MNPSHLFTEVVTVKRIGGHTAAGDPSRSASFTVKARVERGPAEGAGAAGGREDAGAHRVLSETALRVGDLLFFPEDNPSDENTGHTVTVVMQRRTLDGRITHYTASC